MTIPSQILPLEQLTELTIDHYEFSFEKLMELLYFTPNLHTIKYFSSLFNDIDLKLIQQNEHFQYVSTRNKIKRLEIFGDWCTLEQFQIIVNSFFQLEYLKTLMNEKYIEEIIQFLFPKTNNKICSLFFLCITEIPERFLQDLNTFLFIKSKNLLGHCYIKFVKRDLYLWW